MKRTICVFAFLGSMLTVSSVINAQCQGFENFPGGEQKGKEVHVIFRDEMKAENYTAAFPLWEKLYQNSPGASEYHFVDGVTLLEDKLNKTTDVAAKKELKEKILKLYDERIECFGKKNKKEGQILGRKGKDMYYMEYGTKATFETLFAAMELEANEFEYSNLIPLAHMTVNAFVEKIIDADKARYVYNKIGEIGTFGSTQGKDKYREYYKNNMESAQKEYIEQYIGDFIFGCEYYTEKYAPIFDANPNDRESRLSIMEKIKAKCGTSDPFYLKMKTVEDKYLKDQQDSIDAANAAKCNEDPMCRGEKKERAGDLEGAVQDYIQAFNNPSAYGGDAADLSYRIANLYHNLKQYSNARTYYQKAADARSGWGEPLYQIGVLYAASGPVCGSGRGWDSQVVVWAAIDQWNKAKNVDSSVASKCNEKIASYSKYMPSTQQIFERSLKEGDSYSIGCWIGLSTTIRAAK